MSKVVKKRNGLVMRGRQVATAIEDGGSEAPVAVKMLRSLANALERDMRVPRVAYPDRFMVEGNRGGSYILLSTENMPEGMVHLEVGETCIHTVDMDISVAALAIVLTVAKDTGFQKIVDEYCRLPQGVPEIRVEHDPPPRKEKTDDR